MYVSFATALFWIQLHFWLGDFKQSSSFIANVPEIPWAIDPRCYFTHAGWLFDQVTGQTTLKSCFLPCSHSFKSCYRCRLPHRAPQKSNRSLSDATWKVRCRNDLQREITIHYLSSWQHTVSTVSTSAVRCQPLSKRETMWGTWSLLTQCLNDSIPQTWRQCCLLWGLVRSCSSRVQFK